MENTEEIVESEESSGGAFRPDPSQKLSVPRFSVYAEWRATLEEDFEIIVVGGLFSESKNVHGLFLC